ALFAALGGFRAVLAVEALDPASGVDQLLLAREERVARRADLDVDALLGGAGLDDIAAGADDAALLVARMNAFLHGEASFVTGAQGRRNAGLRQGGWALGAPPRANRGRAPRDAPRPCAAGSAGPCVAWPPAPSAYARSRPRGRRAAPRRRRWFRPGRDAPRAHPAHRPGTASRNRSRPRHPPPAARAAGRPRRRPWHRRRRGSGRPPTRASPGSGAPGSPRASGRARPRAPRRPSEAHRDRRTPGLRGRPATRRRCARDAPTRPRCGSRRARRAATGWLRRR